MVQDISVLHILYSSWKKACQSSCPCLYTSSSYPSSLYSFCKVLRNHQGLSLSHLTISYPYGCFLHHFTFVCLLAQMIACSLVGYLAYIFQFVLLHSLVRCSSSSSNFFYLSSCIYFVASLSSVAKDYITFLFVLTVSSCYSGVSIITPGTLQTSWSLPHATASCRYDPILPLLTLH